jgi:hypothetical protein
MRAAVARTNWKDNTTSIAPTAGVYRRCWTDGAARLAFLTRSLMLMNALAMKVEHFFLPLPMVLRKVVELKVLLAIANPSLPLLDSNRRALIMMLNNAHKRSCD